MKYFPVLDLSDSPAAQLHPVSICAVQLRDEFWQPRRAINAEQTLLSQFEHLENGDCLPNFRRAISRETGEYQGMIFSDSDAYKWLEAAASSLCQPNPRVRVLVAEIADLIVALQRDDGYLHSYYTLHPDKNRWEKLRDNHQLYCMGHFIQAAVAHHRATGENTFLNVARRLADCIERDFGLASQGKIEATDGHQEIELALVELHRATRETRYLKLAQFFIEVRGRGTAGGDEYHQDHVAFRDLDRVTGHAVRARYYAAGATDVALETGDETLWRALDAQWNNFTARQMYVSGGAGSRYEGEAFGGDYELPNARAYTETCAAIAVVMWAFRMSQRAGEARYFDVLERALYNGVISGLSLGGDEYFYQNPLADDGKHRRQKWFGCACCPPNVARLLAQLPGYFYSTSGDDEIWAHLFAQNEAQISLGDESVVIEQQTDYPRGGEIRFCVKQTPVRAWSLRVRVPDWASGAQLEINGETREVAAGEYLKVRRNWQNDDVLTLRLPMQPRRVRCHPYALENGGRVAVTRGPLLYCAEAADNPDVDLRGVILGDALQAIWQSELLGGVTVLRGVAASAQPAADTLYAENGAPMWSATRAVELTMIPYYAWANRVAGQMQVWLRAN